MTLMEYQMADAQTVIRDAIQQAGYRAKIIAEAELVEGSTGGLRFTIKDYPDGSLQFALGVNNDEGLFKIEPINEFNRKMRFAKAYLYENPESATKGVALECDYYVRPEQLSQEHSPGVTWAEELMRRWEVMVSEFVRLGRGESVG